jgi:ABC-2 type transport system permease protein
MNIYQKEMRDLIKSLFIWSFGIILFTGVSMMKFEGFQGNHAEVNDLLNSFPQSIKAAFGIGTLELTSLPGYYSIMVVYFLLILTIHAAMLGGHILSKEEIDKTSEFLLPKPVRRNQIITSKLFAGLSGALILNLFMLIGILFFVQIYNEGPPVNREIILLNGFIYLLQILFFVMGMAISAVSKNSKIAGSVTIAVIMAAYFLSIMIDLNMKLRKLVYLTPFKYFDAQDVFLDRPYEPIFYFITFGLIIIFVSATYFFYNRKDILL